MAAAVTRVTITYESPGQPYFTRFTVDPGDSGRRHTVGELLNSFCVQHRKKYGAASDLVRAGELGKAVALLESLEGPAAEPFRDWLVDARHRLVANQAGSLVRARVSLLNRSVL